MIARGAGSRCRSDRTRTSRTGSTARYSPCSTSMPSGGTRDEVRDLCAGIVESVQEPVVFLDLGLRVSPSTPRFEREFGISRARCPGALSVRLRRRAVVRDVAPPSCSRTSFAGRDRVIDFVLERGGSTDGGRAILVNARRMVRDGEPSRPSSCSSMRPAQESTQSDEGARRSRCRARELVAVPATSWKGSCATTPSGGCSCTSCGASGGARGAAGQLIETQRALETARDRYADSSSWRTARLRRCSISTDPSRRSTSRRSV